MAANPVPTARIPERQPLYCACGTPCAHLQNGILVIQSKHHGHWHTNTFPVADLVRMVEVEKTEPEIKIDANTG